MITLTIITLICFILAVIKVISVENILEQSFIVYFSTMLTLIAGGIYLFFLIIKLLIQYCP